MRKSISGEKGGENKRMGGRGQSPSGEFEIPKTGDSMSGHQISSLMGGGEGAAFLRIGKGGPYLPLGKKSARRSLSTQGKTLLQSFPFFKKGAQNDKAEPVTGAVEKGFAQSEGLIH